MILRCENNPNHTLNHFQPNHIFNLKASGAQEGESAAGGDRATGQQLLGETDGWRGGPDGAAGAAGADGAGEASLASLGWGGAQW